MNCAGPMGRLSQREYFMKNMFWACLFISARAWSNSPAILEETLYQNYRHSIQSQDKNLKSGLVSLEQSLFIDALWDLVDENSIAARKVLKNIPTFSFDLNSRMRIAILKKEFDSYLVQDLRTELLKQTPDEKLLLTMAGSEAIFKEAKLDELIILAKGHDKYAEAFIKGDLREAHAIARDLFNHHPQDQLTLYMFCRENRLYPCLMAMRNIHGNIVMNDDNSLWTQKALALSAKGLPSNTRGGSTPAGVLLINSVMPVADQTVSFGKFRRLILDFIPKSKDEKEIKALLPTSSQANDWWKPNVVARNIGRNLLRIHGTGKINTDPETLYYPFMPTSGCIAKRENTYDDVTYQDQRELLDMMMLALDLVPTYENEVEIKGVLYLLEIDNKEAPVTEEDLRAGGIL